MANAADCSLAVRRMRPRRSMLISPAVFSGASAETASRAVTFEARSPMRANIQSPGQGLSSYHRWTVSSISSGAGL